MTNGHEDSTADRGTAPGRAAFPGRAQGHSGAGRPATGESRGAAHEALGALVLAALTVVLPGCRPHLPVSAGPSEPYLVVLGTAQDGGLPQIGCEEALCEAARRDRSRARRVASLLLVDPRRGRRWLIDASPDLRDQVELARGHPAGRAPSGPRPPLFDGIFLTHAHIGHYTGLMWLGREAYGSRSMPVHASDRMAAYLTASGPWSLLVETGAIGLEPFRPEEPIALDEDISVVALRVPHREEFTDAYGFVVRGPRRSVLYVPDIDKWERWDRSLEDALAGVDVALLDGTFFDAGELPGRNMDEIPHPFVVETLRRLADRPPDVRAKVLFTHLNHTNPISDPTSTAAAAVHRAGMGVAFDGQIIEL